MTLTSPTSLLRVECSTTKRWRDWLSPFVAFPGLFLGFAGLQSLVAALINKCWRGEAHRIVYTLTKAFAVALEFSLFVGLLMAAIWSHNWVCHRSHLAPVYDCLIQGMAYVSAILIVGVKCFGTICHGPESCSLVFRAKEAETNFEAALQLCLISRIYLYSGCFSSSCFSSCYCFQDWFWCQ